MYLSYFFHNTIKLQKIQGKLSTVNKLRNQPKLFSGNDTFFYQLNNANKERLISSYIIKVLTPSFYLQKIQK